jgi:hypothetical protein
LCEAEEKEADWQQAWSQLSIAAKPVLFNDTASESSRHPILMENFTTLLGCTSNASTLYVRSS